MPRRPDSARRPASRPDRAKRPDKSRRSSVIIEKIGRQARVFQHGQLVMTVPLDRNGAVDMRFAFKRLELEAEANA